MTDCITEDHQVLYLLGFSPVTDQDNRISLVASEYSLQAHDVGNIRCWLKWLPASLFEGPEAEANLQDINWLTPRVLMHEAAVSAIAEHSVIYPARFGTLFSTLERLDADLGRWQQTLHEYFNVVIGRREWGLKFWFNRTMLDKYLLGDLAESTEGKQSGIDYLRYRKAIKALNLTRSEFIKSLKDELSCIATNLEIPLVDRGVSSLAEDHSDDQLAINLATLASEERHQRFYDQARQFVLKPEFAEYFRIESTGPWAAYSFCPSLE